jgi:diguanylate cyclase (GGDEF)-like protein
MPLVKSMLEPAETEGMRPTLLAVRSRSRLGVGGKLGVSVSILVMIVLFVAVLVDAGLSRSHAGITHLYEDNLRAIQVEADLADAVHELDESALQSLRVSDPGARATLRLRQDNVLLPQVRRSMDELRLLLRGWPRLLAAVDRIGVGIGRYVDLRQTGAYDAVGGVDSTRSRAALGERTDSLLDPLTREIHGLRSAEQQEAVQTKRAEDLSYEHVRLILVSGVALSLLAGMLVVLLLSRNMVPRIRRYSRFATEIAAGRATGPLVLSGTDELAVLGAALNDMTEQRRLLDAREKNQLEFVDTLQVTSTEQEAHELIQRHLHRSLPGSTALILQRNNSANRLQAATALTADSEIGARLVGAEPRSCLAVRFGRAHREGPTIDPLQPCTLCTGRDLTSVCEPLLVSGEVIGSVLVEHAQTLDEDQHGRIKTSVAQAAPVLANLRSLALAEFRANNDSLTGLPNKRATDDSLKRMVAQANRTLAPLTAVMLDLDHFKHINDQFGHGKGDEVLAAVGAALSSCLRASDFAGRFGGEEFLVLLPDTSLEGAVQVAEKMRLTVASITIPGVERSITVSLGIADLLEHAGNATGLIREADRALYSAKAAGRNQTVVAHVDNELTPHPEAVMMPGG